jgi:hypothetical protein
MHLDFASEYVRRSDEEIRLLIVDRQNLVDEAREALDAEVRNRRRNGFQTHVREPEEPRLHVEEEEDDDDENVVVVHSRELRFPQVCPRCLAPADAIVRISCFGGSSWGLIPILDYALGLWRYLFSRYPVPFCSKCGISTPAAMGRAVVHAGCSCWFRVSPHALSDGGVWISSHLHLPLCRRVRNLDCQACPSDGRKRESKSSTVGRPRTGDLRLRSLNMKRRLLR